MPEGDTIFRAARALNQALAGRTVVSFESVYPQLTRVDRDAPIAGRLIDRVTSRGKHLLMWLSGGLILRTHLRMSGDWHLYPAGARWQRPRHQMRIVLRTEAVEAVAFDVPEAEFITESDIDRHGDLGRLGPDPLAEDFDASEAVRRIEERGDGDVADVLLDQTAIAGIGNIFKSEILFACRINPFTPTRNLSRERIEELVATARKFMRANAGASSSGVAYPGPRKTTGRMNPSARLWVYGRAGRPCRVCGTPVQRRKQGPYARSTYWCDRCQKIGSTGTV